jgi:hypothetical protein
LLTNQAGYHGFSASFDSWYPAFLFRFNPHISAKALYWGMAPANRSEPMTNLRQPRAAALQGIEFKAGAAAIRMS